MEPWKSWAVVGIVGAGAAYYYSQSGKSKKGRGRMPTLQQDQSQQRASATRSDSKDIRKKKGKAKASDASDPPTSDSAEVSLASTAANPNQKLKNRKKGKQQPSQLAQSSAVDAGKESLVDVEDVDKEDEEMSNKQFAEQLSGLKIGSSLRKPGTAENDSKRTKKQGKSKELQSDGTNGAPSKPKQSAAVPDMSTASSTTGADADDDLSLPMSPDLGAIQAITPSGGDVSDMLEAPSKGPSVLRITQPTNPQPVKQAKPKKVAPEPETKKQRQNRQKNEQKKAMREEADKERRTLLEKQLRTAREAEGRPAKNGLGISHAPSTSAWDKPSSSQAETPIVTQNRAAKVDNNALLDTFDEDKSFLGQSAPRINTGASDRATEHGKAWNRALPSEEEQMKLMNEKDEDNSWNTVGKGGKGKKKSTKNALADGPSASGKTKHASSGEDPTSTKDTNTSVLNNFPSSPNGKATSDSDNMSTSGYPHTSSDASTAMSSNNSEDPAEDRTEVPNKVTISQEEKHGRISEPQDDDHDKGSLYPEGVPRNVSKRWRAIAKNLDRTKWNYDNIHEHPDYDPDWPYALTGHPMDSDWVADWNAEDMRKANEKRTTTEPVAQKAK